MVRWKIGYLQGSVDGVTVKQFWLHDRAKWDANLTSFGDFDDADTRFTLGRRLMDEGTSLVIDEESVFYAFPVGRNPNRLDIKETHWLNIFDLPFNDRATALSFGEQTANLTWNIIFTDRDEFRNFRQVVRTKSDKDGSDAMTGREPQIVPFVLFMGFVDEAKTQRDIRFGYYDSMTFLREGRRGDNIIEVQVHFKDVTPHVYSATITSVDIPAGTISTVDTNSGKASTKPETIKMEGVDQAYLDTTDTSQGEAYTLLTSVNEGAANRQTFVNSQERLGKIITSVDTDGGQDVTLTLHDSSNTLLTSETKSSVGTSEVTFNNIRYRANQETSLHFHLTVPSGTTKISASSSVDMETSWFEQYYTERGRNPNIYTDADPSNKFRLGRESVDQSQPETDGTVGTTLSSANVWAGMTFQPDQTEISKVMVRLSTAGSPDNLRIRLWEWDTSANGTTGSVLATDYFSPNQASSSATDEYLRMEYSSLDTTKTYVIILDDDGGDGTNKWSVHALTGTSFGDTTVGRLANSSDGGSTYTESTTIKYVLKTYYPDFKTVPLMGGGSKASYITTSSNGEGEFFHEDDFTNDNFWHDITDTNDGQPIYSSVDDYIDLDGSTAMSVTFPVITPFPTKSACRLDYLIDVITDFIKIETSTDNSTWTIEKIINSGDAEDNVASFITLSSDNTKNTTEFYVKFSVASGDDANIKSIKLQVPLDAGGAVFPVFLTGANTIKKERDDISGQVKTTIFYRERD